MHDDFTVPDVRNAIRVTQADLRQEQGKRFPDFRVIAELERALASMREILSEMPDNVLAITLQPAHPLVSTGQGDTRRDYYEEDF